MTAIHTPNLYSIAPGDFHTAAHHHKRRVEANPPSFHNAGSISDYLELCRLEYEASQEVEKAKEKAKSDAERGITRDLFVREMERRLGIVGAVPDGVNEFDAYAIRDGIIFLYQRAAPGDYVKVGWECPACGDVYWSEDLKGTPTAIQLALGRFMARLQTWDCERDCPHEQDEVIPESERGEGQQSGSEDVLGYIREGEMLFSSPASGEGHPPHFKLLTFHESDKALEKMEVALNLGDNTPSRRGRPRRQ